MYGEFTITGRQHHMAGLLTSLESDIFPDDDHVSRRARMVGTLGEMFGALYLESIVGSRSVIAQGLLSRTKLCAGNTLERGDLILVGKRKIRGEDGVKNFIVDAVWRYEVKATSDPELRGCIEARYVEKYAERKVVGCILVTVDPGQHTAHGVIEDVADPANILAEWPQVKLRDKWYYRSPMVQRKMENGA